MATKLTAQETVELALSYLGTKQGSARHKEIIDYFNSKSPHGEKMTYVNAWCSTFASTIAMKAGYTTENTALSCQCSRMIAYAKQLGLWHERDDIIPGIGWFVIYDWQDDGIDDNMGDPDHIGIVYKVHNNHIFVIEGNKGKEHKCDYRRISINDKNIRGFVEIRYKRKKRGYNKKLPTISEIKKLTGREILRKGDEGEAVIKWKKFLNWYFQAQVVKPTPLFGDITAKYTKIFKSQNRFKIWSGSVGAASLKKAQQIIDRK